MRRTLVLATICLAASPLAAQWTPTGLLAGVPVSEDCERAAGAPAQAASGPQIFTCTPAVEAIEQEVLHAAAFFLVHEYGHVAVEGGTEGEADCWAAAELGSAPNGGVYIDAIARWLEARSEEFVEGLGNGADRAWMIRTCSGLAFAPPPAGNSCCTTAGSCRLSEEGEGMPVGTWCYCATDDPIGLADGQICDEATASGSEPAAAANAPEHGAGS